MDVCGEHEDKKICYNGSFIIEDGILKGEESEFLENGKNNYGEILLEQMKKNSGLVAQVDATTGTEDSYGTMLDRSVRCALWLRSHDIGPNDIIAICTHNHKDQVMPALAALYIGAILNPWWDYGLTPEIAEHFISLTKPKVLFVNEECAEMATEVAKKIGHNMKVIVFGNVNGLLSFETIIEKQKPIEVQNFQCTTLSTVNHPALILYTSGTTGMPKGALHSHRFFFGHMHNIVNEVKDKIRLWYSTLCWVTGIICTFRTIQIGGRRILPGTFTPDGMCEIIEQYKINTIMMGTSMANRIVESSATCRCDVSSVTRIYIGGAAFRGESQEQLCRKFPNCQVAQGYGSTEAGGMVIIQGKYYKMGSIGTVVKNCHLKIIEPETGKILGPNEKGELCMKSSYMMIGYFNNPEGTKKTVDEEGWIHTGDLAYYDEDGAIFVTERLNELIKWRGHHVPPALIEQLIQTLPGVTEVVVVPTPHSEDDERPFAFVVKTADCNVTEEIIHELVAQNLPDQMQLRAGIKFMDKIPYTASGKVGRRQLKAIAIEMCGE